jgi:DNA-binding response OmpR family regulator
MAGGLLMAPENDNNDEIQQKRIIYVDDVNYALITIKERLKDAYEVYPTQSVEKMFEILERIRPDLILLDVNMPDVDGFETLKQIKADRRYADIPVMFLSAKRDRHSIIKGMSLGAVDYITKPVSNERLIEYIDFHLDPEKRAADKPIVLAVDDDPSMLQTISALLDGQYVVYTLTDARIEQMLKELLKKATPDLFILDYNMPGITGFELVPIIRAIPGHEATPIIFLTGEGSIDHITVAANLGACEYIVKPIDDALLHKKVASHLTDFIMHRRIRSLMEDDRRK